MKIFDMFDYRNAKAIIDATYPKLLPEIYNILTDPNNILDIMSVEGKQRELSNQVKQWFVTKGWREERPCFSIPEMRYDLLKDEISIPIEVELGHQRLVFPDFFEFLADFSKGYIPAAVMIVTGSPVLFGKKWHCSLSSTKRKILAIQEVFLVPVLVIAVDP
jgi:hypothetical protein